MSLGEIIKKMVGGGVNRKDADEESFIMLILKLAFTQKLNIFDIVNNLVIIKNVSF